MTTYSCKSCGKDIERLPDQSFNRNCDCDSPIIANLRATAYGIAHVSNSKA